MESKFLIDGVDKLHRYPFYWGKMSRDEAKAIIVNYPSGSYIMTYNPATTQFEVHFKDSTKTGTQFVYDYDVIKLVYSVKNWYTHFLRYPVPDHRFRFPSLKELSRVAIRSSKITYDGIESLEYPKTLKDFLRDYNPNDTISGV